MLFLLFLRYSRFCGSRFLLRLFSTADNDRDVACFLLERQRATHGSRFVALEARTSRDSQCLDDEVVTKDTVSVSCISFGAVDRLSDDLGSTLWSMFKDNKCVSNRSS